MDPSCKENQIFNYIRRETRESRPAERAVFATRSSLKCLYVCLFFHTSKNIGSTYYLKLQRFEATVSTISIISTTKFAVVSVVT